MLRDFPACAGLCHNSNIDFCFVDENENNLGEGRGQATKQCIIIFQDRINGEKGFPLYYLVIDHFLIPS